MDESKAEKFTRLAQQWKLETAAVSSMTQMVEHPAYQEIIKMGMPAVPLILDELQREPHHWFAALTAITGEHPIRKEDAGRLSAMTASWLKWGQALGYL